MFAFDLVFELFLKKGFLNENGADSVLEDGFLYFLFDTRKCFSFLA